MAATILLVEDELAVREAVRFHLEHAGFRVRATDSALEAWDLLPGCDAVVLDWMLPDQPGLVWLKRLRESSFSSLPVLMLTARASELDRVEGLDSGADDYLTKPFSALELVARVRALLRRTTSKIQQAVLKLGALEVQIQDAQVLLNGVKLELTRREFDLLCFFAANVGRVFARQELLDKVWGLDFDGTERTVDQHITQLRQRLGETLDQPRFLETVRGKGYRMRVQP
jgi:two-component system, OmpR family, response regulator RegX3